ncbi:MAG: recombinase family protein, partial [Polyangiales bacterium]
MGRVAIYARVSTDDRAVALDAQEAGARAWAHREGHAVTHVYREDGVSGAEWVRRPELTRLRADAARTPRPWDVLVVRDLDRLGRDALALPVLIDDVTRAGATVVEWSTGRPVQLTGTDLLITTLRAGLAQLEREAIVHRTRTALQQRAERGQVTGGRVYGYLNVRTPAGVHYEPHPIEAPTVREMYERHAQGESARAIARSLTARGVAAPRGSPSWAPATVHAILRSERYRGAATWGRLGAEYDRGERKTVKRSDVITYQVPALVSPELWTAAQGRSAPARAASGRRSVLSREPRYLLVGHTLCGHCGGPLASWRTTRGSGPMAAGGRTVVQTYRCGWRALRGPEACAAAYMRPME